MHNREVVGNWSSLFYQLETIPEEPNQWNIMPLLLVNIYSSWKLGFRLFIEFKFGILLIYCSNHIVYITQYNGIDCNRSRMNPHFVLVLFNIGPTPWYSIIGSSKNGLICKNRWWPNDLSSTMAVSLCIYFLESW